MVHAFPHDELKPLSKSFTDSLGEPFSLVHPYLQGASAGTSYPLCSHIILIHACVDCVCCLAGELGDVQNLRKKTAYSGCALSLIDALSTLAVIGDRARFQEGVNWLLQNVSAPSILL